MREAEWRVNALDIDIGHGHGTVASAVPVEPSA
jgi:hypothetical protein